SGLSYSVITVTPPPSAALRPSPLGDARPPPSFPTRRSSDLPRRRERPLSRRRRRTDRLPVGGPVLRDPQPAPRRGCPGGAVRARRPRGSLPPRRGGDGGAGRGAPHR